MCGPPKQIIFYITYYIKWSKNGHFGPEIYSILYKSSNHWKMFQGLEIMKTGRGLELFFGIDDFVEGDGIEGFGAVHIRLARAKQIEIRTIQNKYFECFHEKGFITVPMNIKK